MPVPLAAIAAGVSIGSSVLGIAGGLSSNQKAREAARRQAKLTFAQRMEEITRVQSEQRQVMSENEARIGASNILMSGSAARVMDSVRAGFARDIAWRRESARLEKRAIRKGAPGGSADMATVAQGVGSIANTIMGYKSN